MIAYIDAFAEYLKIQKRYSERTVALYRGAVERFYAYIMCEEESTICREKAEKEEKETGSHLKVNNIRGFVAAMLKEGMAPRSVNLHLSGLGSFCRYLLKEGVIESNPTSRVYRPKEKKRLPQFYSKEALDIYLNSVVGDDYASIRNRTMVWMLYATGMRRSEVANLELSNYDSERKVIKITGKGSKEREIPVIDCLYEKIKLYLQTRSSSFKDCGYDSFFLTDKGRPLYLSFVNNVVKQELTAFREFSGKKSPHLLRHSFATHLLNDGAGLNSIKEVLGHSSLAATQVYTHNSFEQLKKIYITAHPRAKKRR